MYTKNISKGFCILFPVMQLTSIANASDVQPTTDNKTSRPNIIFILTDDHRVGAMGYAGNTIVQTPEMDKLASCGTYFKNAFCSTPICAASRASILTGLYERTHNYNFQTGPCKDEFIKEAYPNQLHKAGYFTGFYGKLGVNVSNSKKLFDIFEDYDRNNSYTDRRGYFYKTIENDTVHLTRYTGQKGIDFIENAPTDKPFFLSLCFSAPHAHDNAPDQYFWSSHLDNLYTNTEIPKPDLWEDKYFNALPEGVRNGFNRTRWAWRFDTPEKYQKMVKGYYRMITEVDMEIAKIRQELAKKGLDKNTIIILNGDNGYFLGERQLADKWLMYDLSVKVPLIIYDPRTAIHNDVDAQALNVDIPATILDLAGVSQPTSYHGKSLMPIVSGKTNTLHRDTILIEHLWEFDKIPPSEGVRTNEMKYFRYVNDKSWEELYDLKKDPRETVNLAKDKKMQKHLAEMRAKCDQLSTKYSDQTSESPSGLMVEYIRDPKYVAIKDSLPEYSWIVPQKANTQKAYQIIVSTTKQNINNNIGDIWNSIQTRSNSSIIEHKGKALKANSTYFWKVRIWDKDNRTSRYSEVQEFKTGAFTDKISTSNYFQMERIHPVSIQKTGNKSYFIDFGKAAFGTIELQYSTQKNDSLTIRLGEKLLDGRIDRNPGGTIRYQEIKVGVSPKNTKYLLKLPADKRNTLFFAIALPDSFGVLLPFRYCEIDNFEGELRKEEIVQNAYFNYFDNNQSAFTSSNDVLNQVWDICKYTIKATTFCGLYVDGDRERIPYEADAYINQLGHYGVDCEYSIGKATIEHFIKKPTWPTEWLLHTSMMMYQDYYYTGDLELVKKYYNVLKERTLMELAREDGLISTLSDKNNAEFAKKFSFSDPKTTLRDIVDWPKEGTLKSGDQIVKSKGERDGYDMVAINTVVNCFYYQNMIIMAELADALGKSSDKDDFLYKAALAKKSINDKLFDKTKGLYLDGEGTTHTTLHSNMFPLAFGIVPKENVKTVTEYIQSKGMACSVYGAQYLLEGLYYAGIQQYALDLMTATNDRSWYNMIRVGSTMTMEAWDMKYKPNSDWNHAWGAAPANIIPRQLWGITPKTPGFGIVSIKPQLGNLKFSTLITPTIRGNIKVSYKKTTNRLQNYSIELPANMAGEFIFNFKSEDIVIINEKKVNLSHNSIRLEPGLNHIEITNNSF